MDGCGTDLPAAGSPTGTAMNVTAGKVSGLVVNTVRSPKSISRSLRPADPLALQALGPLRPIQLLEPVEQTFRVRRDAQEPLRP